MIRRIAVVGANTELGGELARRLSQTHKVHAVRPWTEPAAQSGIDKVAAWDSFEQLVDAMNGCSFAVFCAASDDYPSADIVAAVRMFLAACRETKPARSLVFLSATNMMEADVTISDFYVPGVSTDLEDAIFAAEMDVQRLHADAMDIGVVLHAPFGSAGEGEEVISVASEAADLAMDLLLGRVLPVRNSAAFTRGRASRSSEAARFDQTAKNCGVGDTLSSRVSGSQSD